jgi:hypothetical protein
MELWRSESTEYCTTVEDYGHHIAGGALVAQQVARQPCSLRGNIFIARQSFYHVSAYCEKWPSSRFIGKPVRRRWQRLHSISEKKPAAGHRRGSYFCKSNLNSWYSTGTVGVLTDPIRTMRDCKRWAFLTGSLAPKPTKIFPSFG